MSAVYDANLVREKLSGGYETYFEMCPQSRKLRSSDLSEVFVLDRECAYKKANNVRPKQLDPAESTVWNLFGHCLSKDQNQENRIV
jgi:hypothetical protein